MTFAPTKHDIATHAAAQRVVSRVAPFWVGRAGIVFVEEAPSAPGHGFVRGSVIRVGVQGDLSAALAALPGEIDGLPVEIVATGAVVPYLGAPCGQNEFYDLATKECVPYAQPPALTASSRKYCEDHGGAIEVRQVSPTGDMDRYNGKHGRVWETALPNAGAYEMCVFKDGSACRTDVFEQGLCDPDSGAVPEPASASETPPFWTPWKIAGAVLGAAALVGAAVVIGTKSGSRARATNPIRGIVDDTGHELKPWDRAAVMFDVRDTWAKNHQLWSIVMSAASRDRIERRATKEVQDIMTEHRLRSHEWAKVDQITRSAVRADVRHNHEQRLIAMFNGA